MQKKRTIKPGVKEVIRSTNSKNKKLIQNLQNSLAELRRCTVSVAGLEELSAESIKKIQHKRHTKLQKLKKSTMQLNAFEKKLTAIEKSALSKSEKKHSKKKILN